MLDLNSSTPLYLQIMRIIEHQIITGEWEEGDRLPPENIMTKQFGVSIVTVRNAIGHLCEMGLVERQQGKGTFVMKRRYTRDSRNLMGFSDSCRSQGVRPGGKMLDNRQVLLSDKNALRLGQESGAQGIYISRLRFADEIPVVLEKNYFPMQYSFLLGEQFDDNSLFAFLRERAKVTVARADKEIVLCRATRGEGNLLRVEEGTPLLFVKSVAFSQTDEPLYVGIQVMHGERFSLRISQYAGL